MMIKIKHFISRYRSYIFIVFLYNYFWFIVPIQAIIVNLTEGWVKNTFVVVTAIPGMFFMLYHYFFKYYLAIIFAVYLVYKVIFKKNKRAQHIISLILTILYIILFFYVVKFDVSEFPFPRIT